MIVLTKPQRHALFYRLCGARKAKTMLTLNKPQQHALFRDFPSRVTPFTRKIE